MRTVAVGRRIAAALAVAPLLLVVRIGCAQEPAAAPAPVPRVAPRPDQLEPGVDTSKPAEGAATAAP
jgi:hypothetical protein